MRLAVESRLPTTDDDRLCEVLDDAACRRLLDTTGTGRLGFTDGALPAILPVPFALRDNHVLIPERRGSALVCAVRGSVVAFEAGSYDAATRTGWSVTVVGPTRLLSDSQEVVVLQARTDSARPSASDRCFIAVQLGLLRGWRLSPFPAMSTSAAPDPEADRPR